MFDYFRIDSKWPGRAEVRRLIRNGATLTAIHKAEILEAETRNEIVKSFSGCDSENRFVPYFEMHEFEALLFSDADILAEKTEIDISKIRRIIKEYNNLEEINDDPAKAPAKRRQCLHFNNWLSKLEHLKEGANGEV